MIASPRRILLTALGSSALACALLIGFGGAPAIAAHATAAVTVSVGTAATGQVGPGLAGFSYEKSELGADLFDAHDTALVNLFRLLGPSVLRIGGNTADRINWNPGGSGGSAGAIAPADVTKLAGFLHATGWRALYGINLKTNTPANAASEAQFAAQTLGGSLIAFEIGNEPNLYTTESAYESSYNSYVRAIRAKVPTAVFDGPSEADSTGWATTFASHEKTNSLVLLSTHLYIGNETTGTIPGMLASNASGRLPAAEAAMRQAATQNAISKWRMTESNSYYHGGRLGVSNVEAAALWSLEYMDGIASHGGDGVNFHGGGPSAYSPIVYSGSGLTPTGVQGVYYGELLWVLGGTGPLHAASVSGGSGVTAWGIGNNVFVDNKGSSAIRATVTLAASAKTASEYVLTAPSLSSTAVTIAGSSVSNNGAFNPVPQTASVSGRTLVVNVPADSAALLVTH